MTTRNGIIKYPPRSYKTLEEILKSENQSLKKIDVNYFLEIDPCVHASVEGSKIVEFFNGKSVFLTGATGFIGKLLLEKLLRVCEDIENIFILVRPKRGQDVKTRLHKMFEDPVFSEMKKSVTNYSSKVTVIEGDISQPSLGISRESRQKLINEVNIIIHVAATVNFNAPLRKAAAINVSGTKEIMILAQQCQHLASLIHVSTAYSNAVQMEVKEEFFDPPYDPDEFLRMIENNTDEYLEENLKSILGEWPNTYIITKAIAENVVKNMAGNIPTSICRPASVISTFREPRRGWIDNLYGLLGVVVGIASGVIRVILNDMEKHLDLIPGDIVSNGILAATYQNQFNRQVSPRERMVRHYNFASSTQNPITGDHLHNLLLYYGEQSPPSKAIWYKVDIQVNNEYIFFVLDFLLHLIPAILIDCYLSFKGKKRRMVDVSRKIKTLIFLISWFARREWKMHNENVQNLWKSLSKKDREIFNFSMDPSDFNWNEYLHTTFLGTRLFLMKDDLSTIPAAIKGYRRLYLIHIAVKTAIFFLLVAVAHFIFKRILVAVS